MNTTQAVPSESVPRPYAASIFDRLLDWFQSLPVPTWVPLLLIYAVTVLVYSLTAWSGGTLAPGEMHAAVVFHSSWLPIGLGLLLLWDHAAERAMASFSPALQLEPAELERMRYRLTTMPLGTTEAIAAVAPVLLLLGVIPLDGAGPLYAPEAGVLWWVTMLLSALSYAMLPLLLYHSVRQLRLVGELHERVQVINLFRLRPLFSFSGLTAWTGIGWIVLVQMNLVSIQIAEQSSSASGYIASDIVIIAIEMVLAALAFVLPLLGIHRRLVQAKEEALAEVMRRLDSCYQAVNQAVDRGEYAVEGALAKTIDILINQRQQLSAISTWPWQPGTLRGFASALLLPVVLWMLQQVMGRVLWGG